MTEKTVRAIFLKNYSIWGGNLNEALMASSEEIALAILAKGAESQETLPDIVRTIVKGNSRIYLLMGLAVSGQMHPMVPMSYVYHFDYIRQAMLDVINYLHDNYEATQPWFKERFLEEHLKSMSVEMVRAIKETAAGPANVRGFNLAELKLEEEFFRTALVAILGVERFQKFASAYNKCAAVLRQCQIECKMFDTIPDNVKKS